VEHIRQSRNLLQDLAADSIRFLQPAVLKIANGLLEGLLQFPGINLDRFPACFSHTFSFCHSDFHFEQRQGEQGRKPPLKSQAEPDLQRHPDAQKAPKSEAGNSFSK
jgi:hypothetical protein